MRWCGGDDGGIGDGGGDDGADGAYDGGRCAIAQDVERGVHRANGARHRRHHHVQRGGKGDRCVSLIIQQ